MNFSGFSLSSSAIAVCVATISATAAEAQTYDFNVPAQAASEGVRAFARQANIEIIVMGSASAGRSTNAVRGNMDVRVALERLITGTGLHVRSFDGKVAILIPQPTEETASAEEIVVTGSRIARPELESPMPVSVVKMDEARQFGISTAWEALLRDPAIAPGIGRNNAQGQTYDGGIASINLRNMGTNRTLTLVDSRRRVSGSARTSSVDLNMIPSGMIDRIEVITGGAAAIYGADAVTGAVNIITKKDFQGFEVSGMQGISTRGDAPTTTISAVAGSRLAGGRGSISVGATYVNSGDLRTWDRDYARSRLLYHANPENTGPHDGIADRIIHYDFGEFYYNYYPTFVHKNVNYGYENGAVRELSIAVPTNAKGEFYGGGGEFHSDIRPLTDGDQLRAPLEQFAVIGRFDYQLTDTIDYSARIDYGYTLYEGTKRYYREDSRSNWLGGAGAAWAYLNNPYLPDSIRDFMVSNGLERMRISRSYKEFGIIGDVHSRDSYTVANELSGKLTGELRWDAFFQYGRSVDNISNPRTLRASRWIAARDVIADPVTGDPVCRDASAHAAGCVPYNIFSRDMPTEAQLEWMFATRREWRENTQQAFGGSVVGPVFALPYGNVSIALGAEHRKETLKTREDPLAIPTELAHNAAITRHEEIEATEKVSELYGELVVPLLTDLPLSHRLEIEGAYRYSHYDTFEGTEAWKAGFTWSPTAGVTFRGVRSRSVRAPNFGELYQPITVALNNLEDPCEDPAIYLSPTRTANCQALGITTPALNDVALSEVTSGGNPDLQPETSNSLTLGLVLQPRFLSGFDMTIDYWDIDIKNVITQFSGNQIAAYCVDMPTIDNLFCDQMIRQTDHVSRPIVALSTQQINASQLRAKGLDVGVNYRAPLGAGQIGIGFKGTYLIEKEVQAVPGIAASIVKQATNYDDPRFRATLTVNYQIGKFAVGWSSRFTGSSLHDANAVSEEYYEDNSVPARCYNDFTVGLHLNENYQFAIGMNNAFDVEPPYMPATYTGADGRYDVVGRYVFVRANAKF